MFNKTTPPAARSLRRGLICLALAAVVLSCTNPPAPGATATPTAVALAVQETATPVTDAAGDPATNAGQAASTAHAILPTITPRPQVSQPATVAAPPLAYAVVSGDTLFAIAGRFGVTLEALRAANNLSGDLIRPGQTLVIPNDAAPNRPAPDNGLQPQYVFSPLYSNLADAYPAVIAQGRFTLHYTPGVFDAINAGRLAAMVDAALTHLEGLLGVTLTVPVDVYAAGTLFAAPDQALRGRSFSAERRTFFLADGSGNLADLHYIAAHELTHVLAWNTWGRPSSALLSEGVAVYAGMEWIRESDHLPLQHFCAAYHQAERLPRPAQNLSFQGHIRNLENYYAAGCFVRFLIERYGAAAFGQLYPTSDYPGVYGKSLAELEAEWLTELAQTDIALPFAPMDLVNAVGAVEAAYDALFTDFRGRSEELAGYRMVDAARLALLEGRIAEVGRILEE